MKHRELGKSGIKLSEVGIGTWELAGDVWGPTDDSTSLEALQSGVAAGATFIDTAAGYGSGHVEELVGRFLAKSSDVDRVVVSSKIKPQCGRFAPPPELPIADFYSPDWIRSECEQTLKRLRRDHVDILFMHTWSKGWDAEGDWFETMLELKAEGKIRAIGISVPDEGVSDANTHVALGHVDAIQCVYSVFQQEPEHVLFDLAEAHGVGVVARSPFSSGAVVQRWTPNTSFQAGDWRGSWPLDVKPGWLESQAQMADLVRPVLEASTLSVSVAALKFVLRQPVVSSVIPGSANPAHVAENVSSSEADALDAETVAELEALWRARSIHGTYNGSI